MGTIRRHEFDDDACCIHCGFDGAEWHHWKHNTYEGRAQPDAKAPLCVERPATAAGQNCPNYPCCPCESRVDCMVKR